MFDRRSLNASRVPPLLAFPVIWDIKAVLTEPLCRRSNRPAATHRGSPSLTTRVVKRAETLAASLRLASHTFCVTRIRLIADTDQSRDESNQDQIQREIKDLPQTKADLNLDQNQKCLVWIVINFISGADKKRDFYPQTRSDC